MKITSTFMGIFMFCAVLAFNACDDNSSSKDKTKQNQMLLLLGGKKYAMGDIGPSDVGIVFYITDGGLHGLESAPSGWYGGSDPTADWINGTYQGNLIGAPATAIGTGLTNSKTIVTDNSSGSCAAGICRAYTGGSKTDWFLPSQDEIKQLYLQKTVVGGFTEDYYWSSSETSAEGAYWESFCSTFCVAPSPPSKSSTFYVRPIRAF